MSRAIDENLLANLARAPDLPACIEHFRKSLSPLGIEIFSCGEVNLREPRRMFYYVREWTPQWRAFAEKNFASSDPRLRFLDEFAAPFTWLEARASAFCTTLDHELMALASSSGWVDGFVVPVVRDSSHFSVVTAVSTRPLDPISDKAYLSVFSLYFMERVRALVRAADFPLPPLGLSRREIECLQQVSQGSPDAAIGRALSISATTAHAHVESAKRRLGASTRAQAVSIAMAYRIIHDG